MRRDGGSFAAQLPGRVVVFLNEPYALDANRFKSMVEDDVLLEELYEAARGPGMVAEGTEAPVPVDAATATPSAASASPSVVAESRVASPGPPKAAPGIHSLIVTTQPASTWDPFVFHGVRAHPAAVDIPHASGPSDATSVLDAETDGADRNVVRLTATHRAPEHVATPRRKLFGLFSRPAPAPRHLEKAAAARAVLLHKSRPTEQRVVFHHYAPSEDPVKVGCVTVTASMGSLRVFRGLSSVVAQLGATHSGCEDEQLAFAACKLLPFDRKLARLVSCHSTEVVGSVGGAAGLVVRCILSDLADEQWAWRQHKWSGEWPREKLAGAVQVVSALAAFDVAPLLASETGRAALTWLISHYAALLDVLPSLADRLWFYRRRRILSSVCLAHIRPIIERLPKAEFEGARRAAIAWLRPLRRTEKKRALWSALRNPMADNATRYQHWQPVASAAAEAELAGAGVRHPIEHVIVEEPHVYAPGVEGDAARGAALDRFTVIARADEKMVRLRPLRPGEVEEPDNLDDVRAFSGVVRRQ